MKYIYREEHTVYVDYDIEINDDLLIENGISPYDDIEISNYIKSNYLSLQPESTEWWISAQEGSFIPKVGVIESDNTEELEVSENIIRWI